MGSDLGDFGGDRVLEHVDQLAILPPHLLGVHNLRMDCI